ncbi:hypothetical protein SN811_02740 [Ligilactobacillus agilis]|uniref:Uncharacterized protein n=1 Tax=Ligilactobacillus agilis TaxID=1601 RepID=A0A6F9Y2I8_9LACO|nr:hypothetical protein SN811_02740 [Ligilactobacillus agilis]
MIMPMKPALRHWVNKKTTKVTSPLVTFYGVTDGDVFIWTNKKHLKLTNVP